MLDLQDICVEVDKKMSSQHKRKDVTTVIITTDDEHEMGSEHIDAENNDQVHQTEQKMELTE